MTNPVVRFRRRLRIGRKQLALISGCALGTIVAAELGYSSGNLSPRILKAMAEYGEDPGTVQDEYRLWFEQERERARAVARESLCGGVAS